MSLRSCLAWSQHRFPLLLLLLTAAVVAWGVAHNAANQHTHDAWEAGGAQEVAVVERRIGITAGGSDDSGTVVVSVILRNTGKRKLTGLHLAVVLRTAAGDLRDGCEAQINSILDPGAQVPARLEFPRSAPGSDYAVADLIVRDVHPAP